tara:strand:+ start:1798 stop:2910 length:1113 start_codon:yes stop_codon:yes gene_type:complete
MALSRKEIYNAEIIAKEKGYLVEHIQPFIGIYYYNNYLFNAELIKGISSVQTNINIKYHTYNQSLGFFINSIIEKLPLDLDPEQKEEENLTEKCRAFIKKLDKITKYTYSVNNASDKEDIMKILEDMKRLNDIFNILLKNKNLQKMLNTSYKGFAKNEQLQFFVTEKAMLNKFIKEEKDFLSTQKHNELQPTLLTKNKNIAERLENIKKTMPEELTEQFQTVDDDLLNFKDGYDNRQIAQNILRFYKIYIKNLIKLFLLVEFTNNIPFVLYVLLDDMIKELEKVLIQNFQLSEESLLQGKGGYKKMKRKKYSRRKSHKSANKTTLKRSHNKSKGGGRRKVTKKNSKEKRRKSQVKRRNRNNNRNRNRGNH